MAKYTEKGMYDKLSEFSNSKRKKDNLKKYPDGGGLGKLTYTPYSLGFYSPLVGNPVYNPSQMLTYYKPHLFTNTSQGTFRTPIELSVGLPYDRSQTGLTNPGLNLNSPNYYNISDYNYSLNMPNSDMSQTMYQDVADYLQKDVHQLTQSDLNQYTAAKELENVKPKYETGLPIDVGLRYSIMGMQQNSSSPVRGMLSLMGGYNPQAGFFGGVDAGAYGLLGNVSPNTYLKRGLEKTGEFMFTPSLTLAAGIRQNAGYLPDKEVVDQYLTLLHNDVEHGTDTATDYYKDNLDHDIENVNYAIKPELKFEYRPFKKIPVNLEAVLGANIDLLGKRQGQMDQLIPGVAPYGRASLVFPINQVKKAVERIDMPDINWPDLPEREPREPREPKKVEPCPEGYARYSPYGPCEPIEKAAHPRWLRDGGEYLTVDGEQHRIYKNAEGDIMVNHPAEDKGKWDTINLTDKANAKTVAQGVAATRKWHEENSMKSYAEGGLAKFVTGGPGDKYYKYQNTQYKKDQQGNWYKWNGKTWNMSGSGTSAYDLDNHIGLEDWLQAGRMQVDDANWSNDKPKATVSNYEIQRSKTINNPLATTTQKIKATSTPLASNVEIQKGLLLQKQKEDEQAKKAEQQRLAEEQRQATLRQTGADNTLVDNTYLKSFDYTPNTIFDQYFKGLEDAKTLTAKQKQEANRLIVNGDFANLFPELNNEYLSEENSNRAGGPLTREEILLREMRTNPQFFDQYYSRKEKDWKKREQKAYDNLSWWEAGLNNVQAFIADPLLVPYNAILRGERPLVGQGEWSVDPDDWSDVDNYYFDKFTGKSNSPINNMFNYINIARAGASAGESIRDGEYGQAAFDLATVIPMVKGAKYGWKGLNAAMRTQPLKYIPGIAGTGWGGLTTGQALTGYGMYHAGTENFPNAYEAYSSGDWKKGNEELFMGLANSIPFVAEAKAGIPSFIDDTKALTNKLFQGNTRPLQSTSTTGVNAEKAMANSNLASAENSVKDVSADDFYSAIHDKKYYTKHLSEEATTNLLESKPDIKIIGYEGQSWPSELAPELRTTEAIKKDFESANEFATQWAIQDPEKFNELGKQWSVLASEAANLKQNPLLKVQNNLEHTYFDSWLKSKGFSDQDISELAINAFRSPEGKANWDDLFAEAQPFIQQQIATNSELATQYAISKRLNLKSAKLDKQIKEIPKLIEQTVDPVMKEKIKALYEGAGLQMPEEIGVYNFGTVGADRNKLLFLKPGFEKSPEFLSLTPDDQAYLLEKWKGINGVRTSDATITLGSRPTTTRFLREPKRQIIGYEQVVTPAPKFKVYDPRTWKNYGLKPTTSTEEKWGFIEGTDLEPAILENTIEHYKLPGEVGSTQAHEVGHDIQRLYEDWSSIISEYDAAYGYSTGSDKNAIAAEFKNAMVEPTLPEKGSTIGGKDADFTYETWKSSAKELHSELMAKRFEATRYYMSTYPDMTMKDAINYVKELEAAGDPWLIDNFYLGENSTRSLNKHFKSSTPIETKRRLIQMLPGFAIPLGLGIGYGMSQQGSEESGTPQNRYGGNIKTLSKFIRK